MKDNLFLRKTLPGELDTAFEFIQQGRAFLKSQGVDQWQSGYPDRESIRRDLEAQNGYFLTDGCQVMAYLCLDFDGEPAYKEIQGQWMTAENAKYLVIHRLSFDQRFRGKGLTKTAFGLAEELCREKKIGSIRVDTDGENRIMQRALKNAGFVYCGIIWFAGGEKLAFEKVVTEQLSI